MNLTRNLERAGTFFYHRKSEVLTGAFWKTVWRVAKNRFNFWERVGEKEFQENLAVIRKRPWNLHIELTNLCNANCIFCAYQYQTRPHQFMSDQIFEKVLDDYCTMGGGDLLLEVVVGDPAIDPKFVQRIQQARARPEIIRIETITNAIALRPKRIPELVRSGVSEIQISTGPWEPSLYEKIYRNKSYHNVMKNVRLLLEENVKAGEPVDVKIAFRSNLSMKETLSFPDYQAIVHLPHTVEFNIDYDTWTGEIKAEDLLPGMHIRPLSRLEKEPCFWLYDGPIIFADGSVGMCGCRDFNANSELIVGNIMQQSLQEIWQSEAVHQLRSGFGQEEFPEICKQCTTYANLDFYRTRPGSQRAQLTRDRFSSRVLTEPRHADAA